MNVSRAAFIQGSRVFRSSSSFNHWTTKILQAKLKIMSSGGSLLRGLSTNDGGRLIWTETFELLQQFVEDVLNLSNGSWDSKQYKTDDLDIRWPYPTTQPITLNR